MKRLLTFLLLIATLSIQAQTYTEKQGISVSAGSNGFAEYLPLNYATQTTKRFPLIVFFHGIGERGNGTTDLFKVSAHGPLSVAKFGTFPTSYTSGGEQFSFIMIAPQYGLGVWPSALNVEQAINYAVANYRVDTTRIYLTGLSMGGGAVWDYASSSPTRAARIAAILPVCGALSPSSGGAQFIASSNLPVLATHNTGDPTVPYSNSTGWVSLINSFNPTPRAVLDSFVSTTHDAWTRTYNPANKLIGNTVNAYEWLLQYKRGAGGSTISTPIGAVTFKSVAGPAFSDWLADAPFASGGNLNSTLLVYGNLQTIAGTSLTSLYNYERWGNTFGYNIPVPPGDYTVRLHFSEFYWRTAGQRVFNVDLEGNRVLSNFDILSVVPRNTALQREFLVKVNDNALAINFTSVKDNAKINGIEIFPATTSIPSQPLVDSTRRTVKAVIITEYRDSATNALINSYTNTIFLR